MISKGRKAEGIKAAQKYTHTLSFTYKSLPSAVTLNKDTDNTRKVKSRLTAIRGAEEEEEEA